MPGPRSIPISHTSVLAPVAAPTAASTLRPTQPTQRIAVGHHRPEMADPVIEVVATEGPILGDRLIQVALTRAERQGRLIADNPLQLAGNKDKTYRLLDQPQVIERTSGPRTLAEIPPLELLARIERASELSKDRETANRAVLADYGFKRLTPGVTEVLDCVWRLRG